MPLMPSPYIRPALLASYITRKRSATSTQPATLRLTLPQDVRPMFLPLLLPDPKLMKRPQTRQDTPSQPRRILALDRIPGTMNLDLAVRDPLRQFKVESVRQAGDKASSANDDNVL